MFGAPEVRIGWTTRESFYRRADYPPWRRYAMFWVWHRTKPRLRARPVSAVEAGTGEARTGDHGPVRFAARRVGGVEPLAEELTQPLLAGAAVHGQPLVEDGLELGLADAGPAVSTLELPQRRVESGRAEDLAQRDVSGSGPVVGV